MLMRRLGRLVVRRKWLVLLGAAVFFVVSAALGGSVADRLSSGGFSDPSSESARAASLLRERFDAGQPNLVLLVEPHSGTVDEPEVSERGLALTEELAADPAVSETTSYWSTGGAPPLRGKDGRSALVLGVVEGDEDQVRDAADRITPRFTRSDDLVRVRVGGFGEILRQLVEESDKDLVRAEMISLPITLLLLVLVFGGVVAAGLPLVVGGLAIVGTFLVLRGVTAVTEVSVFGRSLTTAMGLGLAIDYSLFVVSRYREELRAGRGIEHALMRTMATAGRTVAFSAVTVAVSLSALLVFPLSFMRSFAYAGMGVVALAGVGSVVVLPAVLAALGRRVDSLTLFRARQSTVQQGFWYRQAHAVIRRPAVVAVVATAVLVALGIPFLQLRTGVEDDRVLPRDNSARRVHDVLREDYSTHEASAVTVVMLDADPRKRSDAIASYAARLSRERGVARVDAATGFYVGGREAFALEAFTDRFRAEDAVWFSVVPSIEPLSPAGEELVKRLRRLPAPSSVLVGGSPAELLDTKAAITSRLPVTLAIVVVLTFVLLFLMVGSVLVPIKALVMNVLSLSATFGALVWVFQEGHLAEALDFTPTGVISVFLPMLLFCLAFGLSMDYEVFLLSRIKEEYDNGHPNDEAVAVGLEHTGRIVTAAAVLICVVFLAFATAKVTVVKVFGVGLALAVFVDAFLIRMTLVPAFMKLAGRANWWSPRRLRRLHLRYGIWESEPIELLDRVEEARDRRPLPAAAARGRG